MNNMTGNKPIRAKIISMGNTEAGKSCIIKRYCEKRFVNKYLATIGIDYGVTKVRVKDRDVKINIFDMAGHPIFYEVRNEFYKDTQGALLVYDVTNRQSFEALESWLTEMKQEIGDPSYMDKVVFAVCANKIDRKSKRVVDGLEGRLWADSKGFLYFETSACSGEGISEMFGKLFDGVVTAFENGGKVMRITTKLGYTKEQVEAVQCIKNGRNDYERLGLKVGSTKEEINKAYRKLAVLLHPDKTVAPESEEAFKILVNARTNLMSGK
ncbi:dnaJ homolog subfamily C member 27-like [Anneissia japonica]|uniref:dnaJ homolog subfamily C member 27-like n=1 Tax=Anneissia japonica TaxID=1529436 RepID=UPI0014258863|nr:dnaJ homolog subfamily C member 27-like [Anneissia japonica]